MPLAATVEILSWIEHAASASMGRQSFLSASAAVGTGCGRRAGPASALPQNGEERTFCDVDSGHEV